MRKNKWKSKIITIVLAVAMVLAFFGVLPCTDSVPDAKAVSGDEGSDGLTLIDNADVSSPNNKIKVRIWKDYAGMFYYSAYLNDRVVLQCSRFGLMTKAVDLSKGLTLVESSVEVTQGKYDYDLIQGPVNHVNKDYNELSFDLTQGNARITMDFRVDDEGVAYRYRVDSDTTKDNEKLSITKENSSFVLPDSTTLWTTGFSGTYEDGDYTKKTMTSFKNSGGSFPTPILADTGVDGNNAWVLLSEASVYNNDNPYCACAFGKKSGEKSISVEFGHKLDGEDNPENHKTKRARNQKSIKSVDFTDKVTTPWRVAIIGESLDAVTKSTLIPDLNPEPEGDFSWVKPGTSVWPRWSTGSDNIDYDGMKDYIDFCSKAGITYCLVDFGWELWPEYEEKVKGLVEYSNERNVGLLLWYGVHKWDQDHIFDLDNVDDIEEQFAWC